MEAVAKLNNCPMSPRKMRLVVDQIRGQRVEDALNTLKYSQKRVYAEKVEKLLKSAIANWQQVNDERVDEETGLIVKEVFVDPGRKIAKCFLNFIEITFGGLEVELLVIVLVIM